MADAEYPEPRPLPAHMTQEFPPCVASPCNDCPWRRVAKVGWLGPYTAEDWLNIVHGESPIACHQTIVTKPDEDVGDWEHPKMRQCKGAAIFRRNVAKNPKNPSITTGPQDHDAVFSTNEEFLAHHRGEEDFVDPRGVGRRAAARQREEATDAVDPAGT